MPYTPTYQTTQDVLNLNLGVDQAGPVDVSNVLDDSPLLRVMYARSRPGFQFRWTQRLANPRVGFRQANTGIVQSTADRQQIICVSQVLDCSTTVDVAVAEADELGADHLLALDVEDHLRAGLFHGEEQIIGGADELGFPGFAQTVDSTAHQMCLDAGGTASGTLTSVWLIRTGVKDCGIIWGADGQLHVGQRIIQRVDDGDGGSYSAYYTDIHAWMGLQIPSLFSVGRIANVAADGVTGKTLNDKMINAAVQDLFPASRKPNLIAMSRRSLGQLQNSRTPVMFTAAGQYDVVGPVPDSACGGIPIIVTDGITNTEHVLGATG